MADPISVLLVENQPLVRIAIRTVLAGSPGIVLTGEADNLQTGLEMFRRLRPRVTILSLRMPGACAIDYLDSYFGDDPRARIIIFAEHAGDVEIGKALRKGALGYVCKDVAPDELVRAIRRVSTGSRYLPAEIAEVLGEHAGGEELTPAEERVLRMIVGGMSNKEIAFALDVSENTVKTHVQNIFGKIGVSDRTSAATLAIKRGLVRVDI